MAMKQGSFFEELFEESSDLEYKGQYVVSDTLFKERYASVNSLAEFTKKARVKASIATTIPCNIRVRLDILFTNTCNDKLSLNSVIQLSTSLKYMALSHCVMC